MENRLRTPVVGAILLFVAGVGLSSQPARAADDGADKIYKRTLRSTVWVVVPLGGNKAATGTGSLVDVKHRLILTNYHVVGDHDEATVFFPIIEKNGKTEEILAERSMYMKKGARIKGKVVARSPKADLALIQIERVPDGALPLYIARESPSPGQRLHSIGNPGASDALWVYTQGTVRQVYHKTFRIRGDDGFEIDAKIVETQSPVNQGDSGGPVVNDRGELVAVTQGHLSDAQARLVSIFIDVSEIRKLLTSKGVANIRTLPPSDKPKVEAASDQTIPKAEDDPLAKDEKEAARLLKFANNFAADGLTDNARRRYREIIDKFPKTKAADEARQQLEKIKK
jgi:S1-C subfamily serine protease